MIAEKLGVSVIDVERMEAHVGKSDQSLNAPIGEEDSIEQIDLLADTAPSPEDISSATSSRQARSEWVNQALERLTPRERLIISSRFLKDRRNTLAEIGENFGVSKERIRQIEGRALKKMRATLRELVDQPEELLDD